jgi:hypothetical protein
LPWYIKAIKQNTIGLHWFGFCRLAKFFHLSKIRSQVRICPVAASQPASHASSWGPCPCKVMMFFFVERQESFLHDDHTHPCHENHAAAMQCIALTLAKLMGRWVCFVFRVKSPRVGAFSKLRGLRQGDPAKMPH